MLEKIEKENAIKAYKAFNKELKCRGFQYEVGKSYHEDGIEVCKKGFHACEKCSECFSYYDFDEAKTRICEVECWGEIQKPYDDSKICCSDIVIVKELSWEEVLRLCNSGNRNSGNCNSGDCNSGNRNSGHWNSGHRNSGDWNSGDCNSGNSNSGNWNSGNWNSGNSNSGNTNSGDWNSGNWNSGNWNSGNSNSGNWNSGNCNSGDCNSGNWNSGNRNSGFFNTDEPTVRMFNKDTGLKQKDIRIPDFLNFNLTVWVSHDTATDEEKKRHKQEIETCGGFLKKLEYKEAFQLAWNKAGAEEKESVKRLPNFDPDIFYEISGIRV